jgi:hypothetical protein
MRKMNGTRQEKERERKNIRADEREEKEMEEKYVRQKLHYNQHLCTFINHFKTKRSEYAKK